MMWLLFIAISIAVLNAELHISNLNDTCLRCLCHINGCDLNHACTESYCGPFYLSREYWADSGKPTLPDDEPIRREAYQDCTQDYQCSLRTIQMYLAKYGKDCNRDGVTNCFDYMMINYNGGAECTTPLSLTNEGRELLTKFKECKF